MIITFFGHRQVFKENEIRKRIKVAIDPYLKESTLTLMVGNHGEYDKIALSVCRELRKIHPHIRIVVVLTSLAILQKDEFGYSRADIYDDVETMVYDIEEEHFKNQIVMNNRHMVDDSDVVIAYVNFKEYRSGAKRAVNYAKQQNKVVINLYKEEDRPFYGMTREEIDEEIKRHHKEFEKYYKKINKRYYSKKSML